jgi:hypothetical protein
VSAPLEYGGRDLPSCLSVLPTEMLTTGSFSLSPYLVFSLFSLLTPHLFFLFSFTIP